MAMLVVRLLCAWEFWMRTSLPAGVSRLVLGAAAAITAGPLGGLCRRPFCAAKRGKKRAKGASENVACRLAAAGCAGPVI